MDKSIWKSALQKSIRRGRPKEALYWALKLYEDNLFSLLNRLRTIAVEDIADTEVQNLVFNVTGWVEKYPYADLVWLGELILKMCDAAKSREGDDLVNEVLREMRKGWEAPVRDEFIDQHTSEGRRMGRGPKHFWEVGAKLDKDVSQHRFTPYVEEEGDGYHDAQGRKVPAPVPGLKKKQSAKTPMLF